MLTRRQLSIALLAATGCLQSTAFAQTKWPDRPVRIVVPFAAGGGVDIAARLVADKLRERWNQSVVIDNKPGANTLIAATAVLGAPKDGYTLLMTNSNTFFLPAVNASVKMRPLEDFVPIAEVSVDQLVVVAPTSLTGKLPQIIEMARKDPKAFPFGTYGYGTMAHLLLIEVNKGNGLDLAHVPYRGTAPMVQAMLAGDVKLGVSNYGTAKSFIEAGKLRPVAVFGQSRSPFMPDVPTLGESGVPGFEASQWIGLFAPAGTPKDLVQRMAQDVTAVLKNEATVKRLGEMFTVPGTRVMDDFGKLVERDARNQGGMSQAAGIKMGD
ncbi:MAG: tripartite tricarboxylate transporter substrate binding protein [Pseudomonadota bacterium]